MEFTLKQVCELTGASRRAVQGYEALGIVRASGKNKYGHLIYDEAALEQIRQIKFYRDMGFSRLDIITLLDCGDEERKKMIIDKIQYLKEKIVKYHQLIFDAERIINS